MVGHHREDGERPQALDPTVRSVIEAALKFSATDAFRAQYKLRELARQAQAVWEGVDVLFVPTTTGHPTFAEVDDDGGTRLKVLLIERAEAVPSTTVLSRLAEALDGLDLVVCGLGGAAVSPSRARAVVARARSKGAALIVTDGRWEATKLDIDARVVGYAGLQAGRGRLRGVELEVRTRARAATRVGRFELRSARAAVEWVGAQRHLAVAQ